MPIEIFISDPSLLERYSAILGWDPKLGSPNLHRANFVPLTKAQRFIPPTPTSTLQDLFTHSAAEDNINNRCHATAHRFVRRSNRTQFLIYTASACLDNGHPAARAGCAFVFKPAPYADTQKACAFKLEVQGSTGETYPQTSNRAELRAVIAALQYRIWIGERWKSLVIATDSAYVVEGITSHIEAWKERD